MSRIELLGMDELIARVNRLSEQGDEIKKKALERAAQRVKETMEAKAPKSDLEKRHIVDNIKISEVTKEDGVDVIKIGPLEDEFYYAIFTEIGTKNIPAQHWMEKSVLENKREINNIIMEELQRGLEGG